MPKTDAEKRCPTCGQVLPQRGLLGEGELLHILRHGEPRREVYRAQDGTWWVTYGGGQTSYDAVRALLDAAAITEKYNTLPDEVYWVGRTIDMDRTLAERKKRGKAAPVYYVGDP